MNVKAVFTLLVVTLWSCSMLWAQLTRVSLGATREALLSTPLQGFELSHQSSRSITFTFKKTPGQVKKVIFTLRNNRVTGINTTQIITGAKLRSIALDFYLELIKDWEQKPGYVPDQELTAQTKVTFKTYQPKVRAFFDETNQRRMVLMTYNKNQQTILTQLAQQL